MTDKEELRAEAMLRRDGLPLRLRRRAARKLADVGLGFVKPAKNAVISGYSAIDTVLDPWLLLERLHREGLKLCLPVLEPKSAPLRFREWAPTHPVTSKLWGIKEPEVDAPLVVPDILLVPLLTFDAQGNRLGYGGGYYDRTLTELRSQKPVVAIGIAYDGLEAEAVPQEPWDELLDWVLTPSGAKRCTQVAPAEAAPAEDAS